MMAVGSDNDVALALTMDPKEMAPKTKDVSNDSSGKAPTAMIGCD